MRKFLLATLFLGLGAALPGQDTLSFGGIRVAELPEAEVRAYFTPVSPLARAFTVEEVRRLAGTFYDPARLVALLPGTIQTNDQANHLSVRGNSPNANLWRLNGAAIVNPNHTANAGTLYDLPTLSGGGVNAISAQVLANSAFISDGLPAAYGGATGGTFDLRLRPGTTEEKFRPQVQAGFIGFDAAAEGTVGKRLPVSYLVNARYSFTGLLAAAGVDFGGESIGFQDLNAHLNFGGERSNMSVFAILGSSENIFRAPEDDVPTEEKELYDIDFNSELSVLGYSWDWRLGAGELSVAAAISRFGSDRSQEEVAPASGAERVRDFRELEHRKMSLTADYELPLSANGELQFGAEIIDDEVNELEVRTVAPFVAYRHIFGTYDLSLGLRSSIYREGVRDGTVEPRVRLRRRWNNQRLILNYERVSAAPLAQLLMKEAGLEGFVPVQNQFSIAYGRKIGGVSLLLTPFFQYTDREYGINFNGATGNPTTISANGFYEIDPNFEYGITTPTHRYGLELEAGGGSRATGWYYRGNVTLLRSGSGQNFGDYSPDRYDIGYAVKGALGREWPGTDRKSRLRTFGLNLTTIVHGGENYGIVTAPGVDDPRVFRPQDLSSGFVNSLGTYFRPDLRLYRTRVRPKTTTTLALDLQNVAAIDNTAGFYYDTVTDRVEERQQLSLIPVLSYRIEWR